MQISESLPGIIIASFLHLLNKMISLIPQMVAALVVFIFGLFFAEFAGKLVTRSLKGMLLDDAINKTGSKKIFEKIGITYDLSKVLGLIVTWFLYIVFLIAIADILKLSEINDFLTNIILYVPNVVVAIVILIVGLLVSDAVKKILKNVFAAHSIMHSDFLVSVARWSILIFSLMAALVHLRVATNLVTILFAGVVFAFSLSVGLSFGLGGQDAAREILSDIRKNRRDEKQ